MILHYRMLFVSGNVKASYCCKPKVWSSRILLMEWISYVALMRILSTFKCIVDCNPINDDIENNSGCEIS